MHAGDTWLLLPTLQLRGLCLMCAPLARAQLKLQRMRTVCTDCADNGFDMEFEQWLAAPVATASTGAAASVHPLAHYAIMTHSGFNNYKSLVGGSGAEGRRISFHAICPGAG
jgi:hypothetical protein